MRSATVKLATLLAGLHAGSCALVMGYGDYVEEEPIQSSSTGGTGGSAGHGGAAGHGGGGAPTGFVADWSYRGGDGDIQSFNAVALAGSGDVLLAGSYQGSIDLFGEAFSSPAGLDLAAARLTPAGAAVWTKGKLDEPPTGSQLLRVASDIVADASGNVILTGGLTNAGGAIDGFLVGLDGGTGDELWLVSYDGGGTDATGRLALDSSSRIRLFAEAKDKGFTFGSAVIPPAGPPSRDLALATCTNTTCSTSTVKLFGGPGDDTGAAIAADPLPGGAVFVTGNYEGTWSGLADAGTSTGVFVNKHDADGDAIWTRGFVQKQPSSCPYTLLDRPAARALATLPGGDVVATGVMCGDTSFGLDESDADVVLEGRGAADVFVVRLSGQSGKVVWARVLGDAVSQMGSGVAVGANDAVYLTGLFAGTLDLGPGQTHVGSPSTQRLFLAELSGASGDCVRSAAFGDGEPAAQQRLVLGARPGALVLAGTWTTALDFGAGALAPHGGLDAFVVSFSP